MLEMPCSHKVVLEGMSDSKAEKNECERKLNDPTTPTSDSLRNSFDRLKISIRQFGFGHENCHQSQRFLQIPF